MSSFNPACKAAASEVYHDPNISWQLQAAAPAAAGVKPKDRSALLGKRKAALSPSAHFGMITLSSDSSLPHPCKQQHHATASSVDATIRSTGASVDCLDAIVNNCKHPRENHYESMDHHFVLNPVDLKRGPPATMFDLHSTPKSRSNTSAALALEEAIAKTAGGCSVALSDDLAAGTSLHRREQMARSSLSESADHGNCESPELQASHMSSPAADSDAVVNDCPVQGPTWAQYNKLLRTADKRKTALQLRDSTISKLKNRISSLGQAKRKVQMQFEDMFSDFELQRKSHLELMDQLTAVLARNHELEKDKEFVDTQLTFVNDKLKEEQETSQQLNKQVELQRDNERRWKRRVDELEQRNSHLKIQLRGQHQSIESMAEQVRELEQRGVATRAGPARQLVDLFGTEPDVVHADTDMAIATPDDAN